MKKAEMTAAKKRSRLGAYNRKDIIFYAALMAFPVVQFLIFYIVVNANSLLLTFRSYDTLTGEVSWVGWDNLAEAFRMMTQQKELLDAMGTSFLAYAISLCIGTPLALLFSFYIYKEYPASGAFRVLLFLPSIVSAIVMVTIFQFFSDRAVPEVFRIAFGVENVQGLSENPDTRFAPLMFYNLFVSFGTSTLTYSNAMDNISPAQVDAARLEGAVGLREFYYITFPMIYPTFSTFFITGVATIFTNQYNLYSFFGEGSSIQTYGYWLYVQVAGAVSQSEYPVVAAVGIFLTIIAVPLTLIVKKLLEKFGPSED